MFSSQTYELAKQPVIFVPPFVQLIIQGSFPLIAKTNSQELTASACI